MPTSIMPGCRASGSVAASTTIYWVSGMSFYGGATSQATEANAQVPFRTAGVISHIYLRVNSNDRGASTYKLRKNGSNGNGSLSIGASTTGEFEDTTNSDTVAAGDKICFQLVTGAGGTTFISQVCNAIFRTQGNTMLSKFINNGAASTTFSAASTNNFSFLTASTSVQTSETNLQTIIKAAGTLKNFYLNVSSNARGTTTTAGSRKNAGAGNLTVSVGAAATGLFEDTSNSDTLVVGDTSNYIITTGSGAGNFIITFIGAEFINTNAKQILSTQSLNTQSASTTLNTGFGALNGGATESTFQTKALYSFMVDKMTVRIAANTLSGSTTVKTRINGSNGNLSISIGAAATGDFSDLTNKDVIGVASEFNIQTIAGTGTSIQFAQINMILSNLQDDSGFFGFGI